MTWETVWIVKLDGMVVRSGWMMMEEGVDGERGVDG